MGNRPPAYGGATHQFHWGNSWGNSWGRPKKPTPVYHKPQEPSPSVVNAMASIGSVRSGVPSGYHLVSTDRNGNKTYVNDYGGSMTMSAKPHRPPLARVRW